MYSTLGEGRVSCGLCAHRCTIAEGRRGVCGVRENQAGKLYSLVYGKLIASHVDPIEKKPLFHYLPGSMSYSIATVGCNLRCRNCQNWDISQGPKQGGEIVGREVNPEEVVNEAIDTGCQSIAYTYNEPTIFMEYALDTAKLACEQGLGNVFVSNGFMTPESADLIQPVLDADNIDLKSFSDKFYRENCGAALEPVLETMKRLKKAGVWIEVTTLIIPTLNDSVGELRQIAEFIKDELGPEVPWHLSRFHPDYKLKNLSPTPIELILAAREIGLDSGLKYVYAGNVPHENYENTFCWNCGTLLIERYGFSIAQNNVEDSRCPECSSSIDGVGL